MPKFKSVLTFVLFLSFLSLSALLNAKSSKDTLSYEELHYSISSSIFSLWAPTATQVRLNMFTDGFQGNAFQVLGLKQNGVFWSVKVKSNLLGKFYTFQIKQLDSWLNETPGIQCKATGVNGKRAAILDLKTTDPQGGSVDTRPVLKNFTDIILYGLHLRDFSVGPLSGMKNKGKNLALTEGQTSAVGLSTGIDHLKELGVTHVHILPAFDFGCIDETKLAENKYNWGYDPQNYNLPEGSTTEDLIRMDKLAQTMVFTAQGVPFLLSGEELLRTKMGVSNSFESPDSINQLHWENKLLQTDAYNYYMQLIRLRKEYPAFRMSLASDVRKNLIFLENVQPGVVGFLLKNNANGDNWKTILVIHNGKASAMEMEIPAGTWNTVVSDGKIDWNGMKTFSGSRVTVSPVSSLVAFIN